MTGLLAGLERRGTRIAGRRAEQTLISIEREALETVRGVEVEREAGRVLLSGRRLARRWLTDPALRFLGRSGR